MELYGLKNKDGKEYKIGINKEGSLLYVTAIENYPEPKFKVGDWVVVVLTMGIDSPDTRQTLRVGSFDSDCYFLKDAEGRGYGHATMIRHATKDEIETYLRKIADEKYPIGTNYFSVPDGYREAVRGTFRYYNNGDYLTDGHGGCIYCNGKWAEIVPSKKKLPKTKEDIKDFLNMFSERYWDDKPVASAMEKFLDQYED